MTHVPSGQGSSITEIEHSTMAACRLSCDPFGALWPVPTGEINLGYEVSIIVIKIVFLRKNNLTLQRTWWMR